MRRKGVAREREEDHLCVFWRPGPMQHMKRLQFLWQLLRIAWYVGLVRRVMGQSSSSCSGLFLDIYCISYEVTLLTVSVL